MRLSEEERRRRHNEQQIARYWAHRDEILERNRRWRREHPDRCKVWRDKWLKEHREEADASTRRWREAHPDRVRELKRESYHRRQAAMTPEEREAQKARRRAYRKAYEEANRERILARKRELRRLRREQAAAPVQARPCSEPEPLAAPVPEPVPVQAQKPEPTPEPKPAAKKERKRGDIMEQRREAVRRWRERHREEILARKRERYQATKQARKERDAARYLARKKAMGTCTTHREIMEGRRTPGRVCTGCSNYLQRPTCTADVFEVLSCGIRIAETCTAYNGIHAPAGKSHDRKEVCA